MSHQRAFGMAMLLFIGGNTTQNVYVAGALYICAGIRFFTILLLILAEAIVDER